MSGGRFRYTQRSLGYELFNNAYIDYGLGSKTYNDSVKSVRQQNPLEDKIISEMAYDVLCLIHSYDWYASDDTCEETYRKDVEFFKNKWLKQLKKAYIQNLIDEEVQACKDELYKAFSIGGEAE